MTSTPQPHDPPGTLWDGKRRVVQLVPAAPGWWAQYYPNDAKADRWSSPVACWALVEDTAGKQSIVGVDPTGTDWSTLGDPIDQEVVYFFSPESPDDAEGDAKPDLPER